MDDSMRIRSKSINHTDEHYFDLFLFVNPLDTNCFQVEKEILTFVNEAPQHVSLRIFCYHDTKLHAHDEQTIASYADFNLMANYQVALAFKTAALQGKHVANRLLLSMQHNFIENRKRCQDETVKTIIRQNNLDYQMWLDGFTSRYIRKDYQKDIQLMREMNVTTLPALIVSDSTNADVAIKIEHHINAETLHQLFNYFDETARQCECNNTHEPSLKIVWHK